LKKFAIAMGWPPASRRLRRGRSDQHDQEAVGVSVTWIHSYRGKSSVRIPDEFQPVLRKMTFSNDPMRFWVTAVHHLGTALDAAPTRRRLSHLRVLGRVIGNRISRHRIGRVTNSEGSVRSAASVVAAETGPTGARRTGGR
jgi:hypothetical protein